MFTQYQGKKTFTSNLQHQLIVRCDINTKIIVVWICKAKTDNNVTCSKSQNKSYRKHVPLVWFCISAEVSNQVHICLISALQSSPLWDTFCKAKVMVGIRCCTWFAKLS